MQPVMLTSASDRRRRSVEWEIVRSENAPLDVLQTRLQTSVSMPPVSIKCGFSLAMAIQESVRFVSALLAYKVPEGELAGSYEAWVEANPWTSQKLVEDFTSFVSAKGLKARAKAFFKAARKIFRSKGFAALFSLIRKSAKDWWTWVKSSVAILAQLTQWFGSERAAFTAQLSYTLLQATDLVVNAKAAAVTCLRNATTPDSLPINVPDNLPIQV
jgi:hypothetical protein